MAGPPCAASGSETGSALFGGPSVDFEDSQFGEDFLNVKPNPGISQTALGLGTEFFGQLRLCKGCRHLFQVVGVKTNSVTLGVTFMETNFSDGL